MSVHNNSNNTTNNNEHPELGDPEVAARLVALAQFLPGSPPPDMAKRVFTRRDVQESILRKMLEGPIHPRQHPLFSAFDWGERPDVDPR
ncbi:hypothetical protein [Candidatus Microthrix parvicella]|nr:hypothetical protein [Candidatus Microthrix parvicella]